MAQTDRLLHRGRWLWPLGAVLLAALAYFALSRWSDPAAGASKSHAASMATRVPVVATRAKQSDVGVYLVGLGTVTSANTVSVHSRVDGQLVRVFFAEGQLVEQGQALAEIDPRPFAAQLLQAEGQLARDQAQLENARLDLQRYQTLVLEDAVPAQLYDTQRAVVRQLEGTVELDRGLRKSAELQLSYCHITAPLRGRLGLRLIDPGNIVHASDVNGIVAITQLQPIAVIFTLPEDQLPALLARLAAGERLPVEAFDRQQTHLLARGSLLTVDNLIDTTTGTVRLKALFDNTERELFPNQFVNARLLLTTERGATVVPSAAIQRGSEGTFVFVVKADNTAEMRPVKLGAADGDNVAITEGLAPGDMVIIDGADKVREGSRVELERPGGSPPARGSP
jgi:membrane fusion protein, multidrug efflux system